MSYDYFYGQSGELFSYFRIPKALFHDCRFRQLSTDARTLYGILLDRMSLSAKNGCSKRHPDKPRAEIIRFNFTEPEKTGLYTLWENLTVGYDDLLTTPVVSELTGYSAQSIQRWCNQKILVGFKIRGTLTIPRLAVVEFMSDDRATAIVRKSSKHLDLLRTYAQDCHEGAMTITC